MTVENAHGNRDVRVPAKKTPQGWLIRAINRQWVTMDKDAEILSKKPVSSMIAQVPSAGYVQKDTFSKASIQWLEYVMEASKREGPPLEIRHALNRGEVLIAGTRYKVDGLSSTGTVYEYHGTCRDLFIFYHSRGEASYVFENEYDVTGCFIVIYRLPVAWMPDLLSRQNRQSAQNKPVPRRIVRSHPH